MTSRSHHRHTPPLAATIHNTPWRTVGRVWEWDDGLEQMAGIIRYASTARWIIRRRIFNPRIMPDGSVIHELTGKLPDGIIAQLSPYAPELPTVRELAARGMPVVELGKEVPDFKVPRVLTDFSAEGALAARHFLERGFRNLVYLGNPSRPYHEGFVAEAAKSGLSVIALQFPAESSVPPAESYSMLFKDLLATHRPPIGVFVPFLSEVVMNACLERNLLMPEQIALITVGSTHDEFEYMPVPITVVVPDVELRSFTAAALLDRMMRGDRDVPAVTLIPPRGVIARASTRIAGVADAGIAQALNHILSNIYDATLSLKSVARAAGLPLWHLYREFPKHASMTVARYIQHQRILHARHLLETTHLTASEIAPQCGFSELRQFRDALRRTMNTTPSAYRAHHCSPPDRQIARRTALPATTARHAPVHDQGKAQPDTVAFTGAQSGVQSVMARRILVFLQHGNLGKRDIALKLGKQHRTRYLNDLVRKMVNASSIEYTIPGKPNSRLQQYRLTKKGRKLASTAASCDL